MWIAEVSFQPLFVTKIDERDAVTLCCLSVCNEVTNQKGRKSTCFGYAVPKLGEGLTWAPVLSLVDADAAACF